MQGNKTIIFIGLSLLLIIVMVIATGSGALKISPQQIFGIVGHQTGLWAAQNFTTQQEVVFLVIRLPRVLLGGLIGASLAISGAAMQGLFRNPLADPSLIGISAGAALSAATGIVLLGPWLNSLSEMGSVSALSVLTFLGALITTWIVFHFSQVQGKTLVATMLLAGIAINAFAGAGTGLMTFIATDDQLRTLTFWTLGSLGGATWQSVGIMFPFCLLSLIMLSRLHKALNAFALGEDQAAHIGTSIEKVKQQVIIFSAMSVGASVALAGVIGFIGLVVPHMLRLIGGADHRFNLPASALGGALLITLADTVARTALAPAELPIGIITSLVGAPVFLGILIKDRNKQKWF